MSSQVQKIINDLVTARSDLKSPLSSSEIEKLRGTISIVKNFTNREEFENKKNSTNYLDQAINFKEELQALIFNRMLQNEFQKHIELVEQELQRRKTQTQTNDEEAAPNEELEVPNEEEAAALNEEEETAAVNEEEETAAVNEEDEEEEEETLNDEDDLSIFTLEKYVNEVYINEEMKKVKKWLDLELDAKIEDDTLQLSEEKQVFLIKIITDDIKSSDKEIRYELLVSFYPFFSESVRRNIASYKTT